MNPTLTIYASLRIAGLTALTAFACTSLYGQAGADVNRDYARVLAIASPHYYVDNAGDEALRRQLAAALAQAEDLDPETLAFLDRLVLWITPLDLLRLRPASHADAAIDSPDVDDCLVEIVADRDAIAAVAVPTLVLRHALEPRGP